MLDFLFITSPSNASNPHPPYYFLYLIQYLENAGFSCKLIDPKGKDTPEHMGKHMLDIRAALLRNPSRFVGLAAFHSDYDMVMKLGKMIKECQPYTTLMVGNAHPTINPEDFIYVDSPFDIAILGEGEATCEEIAKLKTLNNATLQEVKSIAYLNIINTDLVGQIEEIGMCKTEPRVFIDMEEVGIPAYEHIDLDSYLQPQKSVVRRLYMKMMPIFAGRGCPFHCTFCAADAVWKANKGKACRLRTVDSVIKEIHWLRMRGMDFFYLFDDMFGMNKKWTEEWYIKKAEYDEEHGMIPYACQTRADIADENMIIRLRETGCIQMDFGVEAGSQRLLDFVKKKITKDQVRNAFSLCKKHKMRSFATMLLNLPSETEEDVKETYEFLKEIDPTAGLIFGVTTPYPGSEIYKFCDPPLKKEEYGLLINNRLNPLERFRMADHDLDLEKVWNKWNRDFKATPMFERMWAMNPFQPLYWAAILKSKNKSEYIKAWSKDLIKTFLLFWSHKFNFYRFLKRIQYKKNCKY